MKTQIIAEDRDILVCQKPAGLAVQSARVTEADMVSELKNYLAGSQKSAGRQPVYLGVIHRLDQPVSGILVFAKNKKAAADLSRQVTEQHMRKTYRAMVFVPEGEGPGLKAAGRQRLTDHLVKEPGGGARVAAPGEKDAKKAELFYQCLSCDGNRALLEIDLLTGRHHQIRVQMANAGMPLLGDNRYGSPESRAVSAACQIYHLQLQAVKLEFTHPTGGERVSYELKNKISL